jgi:hypothetical protein
MKCPKCNHKFPMLGNSEEKAGVPTLECPKCQTRFELHSLKKMFPKGILFLFLAFIPLSFLPPLIAMLLIAVISIPFIKWLFKPENIVSGNGQ